MSEENKPDAFLTVGRLIKDLEAFDSDAEVAVIITGNAVTLPVVNLINTSSGARKFALMAIPMQAVQTALTHRSELDAAVDAQIVEGGIN